MAVWSRPIPLQGKGVTSSHRGRRLTSANNDELPGRATTKLLWRLGAGVIIAAQACGGAGVRPYLTPLPEAVVDTLRGDAEAMVLHLSALLRQDSIAIARVSDMEGYLESVRFDASRVTGDTLPSSISPVVRLRFWIDPIGEGEVQVAGEAVTELTVDPSLPQRQREIMVPPNHPGLGALERMLADLRRRFSR